MGQFLPNEGLEPLNERLNGFEFIKDDGPEFPIFANKEKSTPPLVKDLLFSISGECGRIYDEKLSGYYDKNVEVKFPGKLNIFKGKLIRKKTIPFEYITTGGHHCLLIDGYKELETIYYGNLREGFYIKSGNQLGGLGDEISGRVIDLL